MSAGKSVPGMHPSIGMTVGLAPPLVISIWRLSPQLEFDGDKVSAVMQLMGIYPSSFPKSTHVTTTQNDPLLRVIKLLN